MRKSNHAEKAIKTTASHQNGSTSVRCSKENAKKSLLTRNENRFYVIFSPCSSCYILLLFALQFFKFTHKKWYIEKKVSNAQRRRREEEDKK